MIEVVHQVDFVFVEQAELIQEWECSQVQMEDGMVEIEENILEMEGILEMDCILEMKDRILEMEKSSLEM